MQSIICINCPKCKEKWDAETPGEVKCPSCKFSFFANEDGVPEKEEGIVTCPDCGDSWYGEPPGEYNCDCGCLFDVDELGVVAIKRNEELIPKSHQSLIHKVLDDMRHKLLDLTSRNRLLNYKEGVRSIRIINENPDEIYGLLVDQGKSLELAHSEGREGSERNYELLPSNKEIIIHHTDSCLRTIFPAETLESRCKRLSQEAKTSIEETGSNILHLSIGFLEWYEDGNSTIVHKAPLIILPVRIEKGSINKRTGCFRYFISYTGEDIETNYSLVEKLEHDFGLFLPKIHDSTKPDQYFKRIEKTVLKDSRWRVVREIVLGLFSFAKILMFKDLGRPNFLDHDNVKKILVGNGEFDTVDRNGHEPYEIDGNPNAESIPLILDADSSQHSAIIDSLSGNIAIEGPPGTGKSQTISNIIAASLNLGKSVLFVAEKKAALDVVKRRLDNAGIGTFCLELHSHKTQKAQFHRDLEKRIRTPYSNPQNIDREIKDLRREIERIKSYTKLVTQLVGTEDEPIYDIFRKTEHWRTKAPHVNLNIFVEKPLDTKREDLYKRVLMLEEISGIRAELPDEVIDLWNGLRLTNILFDYDHELKTPLESLKLHNDNFCNLLNGKDINNLKYFLSMKQLRLIINSKYKELHTIPTNFNTHLAEEFLDKINASSFDELTKLIAEYEKQLEDAKRISSNIDKLNREEIRILIEAAADIEEYGYGKETPYELGSIISDIESIYLGIEKMEECAVEVVDCLLGQPRNMMELLFIKDIADIFRIMPTHAVLYKHSAHASMAAIEAYGEAKARCSEVSNNLDKYSDILKIQFVQNDSDVLALSGVLRKFEGSMLRIVSSDYRRARKEAKRLLAEGVKFKIETIADSLDAVAMLRKTENMICNSKSYIQVLGPLFTGLDTDWGRLEKLISWSQRVRVAFSSENHACSLVDKLNDVRERIINAGTNIEVTWNRINQAASMHGIEFDLEANLKTEVAQLKNKVEQLRHSYNRIMKHDDLKNESVTFIKACLNSYLAAVALERQIQKNERFSILLKQEFKGVNTNIKEIKLTAEWIKWLKENSLIPNEIVEWLVCANIGKRTVELVELIDNSRDLIDCYEKTCEKLSSLGILCEEEYFGGDDALPSAIGKKVEDCLDSFHHVSKWADFCRKAEQAYALGLSELVNMVKDKKLSQESCKHFYMFKYYESMSRDIVRSHPELQAFTRVGHEKVIDRFRELDRQIIEKYRDQIAYNISRKLPPRGVSSGRVRDFTELHLLKHEASKKKRHLPLRQLIKRAGQSLRVLKPCFMMSPLSVAQYLEAGSLDFDTVIMDEASQLRPAEALGAIARAKQLVVVGDPKQLPPTTFFQRVGGDEEDDDATAAQIAESILDICSENFPTRRLLWHYRSEHESLIAFSNKNFYDDSLIIYPAPFNDRQTPGMYSGVHSNYIEGIYQRGRNRIEAEAVVMAIIKHFGKYPKLSLGVATFNREQCDLISDILEKHQKQDSWLDRTIRETEETYEPFFIKNLENVQGDERDVIYISTTYGPDPTTHRVYQNYGPINNPDGWRRLNVIITRARKRVEVFTSMRPADIKPSLTSSPGVKALKDYIEYAESGILHNHVGPTGKGPDSDFEIAVANILKKAGYDAIPQVGVAGYRVDIGVKHPLKDGKYILGIECDGASYHSPKSVRDRDRLRQEILERMGWKIHRIWSTDWFKNREIEVDRLFNCLRDIIDSERTDDSDNIKNEQKPDKQIYVEEKEEIHARGDLRQILVKYNDETILPIYPDRSRGILREEMLNYFVNRKPITRAEFLEDFPLSIRQQTDGDQMQYLEEIFDLIDDYISS